MIKVAFTGVAFIFMANLFISGIVAEEPAETLLNRPNLDALRLIKDHTPIIWLANDERLHPMIPHPFAFDGLDNDEDGVMDLEDADEVSMDDVGYEYLIERLYKWRKKEKEIPVAHPEATALLKFLKRYSSSQNSATEMSLQENMRDVIKSIVDGGNAGDLRVRVERSLDLLREKASYSKDTNFYEQIGRLEKQKDQYSENYVSDSFDDLMGMLKDAGISLMDIKEGSRKIRDKHWEVTVNFTKDNWSSQKGMALYSIIGYQLGESDEYSLIIRREMLPPPRVVYYYDPDQKVKHTRVLQYWFYYVLDMGFAGHKHDSEHAFVFLDGGDNVKGFVGAGHTSATANNILVTGDPRTKDRVFPDHLPRHMPVLVELGKHASAPDRNMDGRFDPGMDADIFANYAWGSRDIMTTTGSITIDDFRQEFSYPRSERRIIIEESLHNELYAKSGTAQNNGHVENSHEYMNVMDQLKKLDTIPGIYSLVPLEYLRELHELLGKAKAGNRTKESIEEWLEAHKTVFWGKRCPEPVRISEEAFEAMKQWSGRHSNAELWEKSDHKRPENIFKLWLFPSFALDPFVKLEYSRGLYFVPGIGLRYSNPLSILGRSSFELRLDHDFHNDESDIGLLINWPFGIHRGLYGGLGWGNISGIDISLKERRFEETGRRNCLAVYAGVKVFSWDIAPLWHTQLELIVGWRGEVHTPESSQTDLSTLQFNIVFAKGFAGPRHPLDH